MKKIYSKVWRGVEPTPVNILGFTGKLEKLAQIFTTHREEDVLKFEVRKRKTGAKLTEVSLYVEF